MIMVIRIVAENCIRIEETILHADSHKALDVCIVPVSMNLMSLIFTTMHQISMVL